MFFLCLLFCTVILCLGMVGKGGGRTGKKQNSGKKQEGFLLYVDACSALAAGIFYHRIHHKNLLNELTYNLLQYSEVF